MKFKFLTVVVIAVVLSGCSSSQFSAPELISDIQPYYPLEAEMYGLEGTVKLAIKISSEGKVDTVVVRKSAGSEILDAAAIDYARDLEFIPAKTGNEPVATWVSWNVKYHLSKFSELNKMKPKFKILVFTKTASFKHESIQHGINALSLLAKENNFTVDVTSKSNLMNDKMLSEYAAIVFLNTSGDILNSAEQSALVTFIRRGGGFVGIHGATDTEYDWPWYGSLVGAYFDEHPEVQTATINVTDRTHISTEHLPEKWERRDEWYNLRSELPEDIHVLALIDESTYEGGKHGDYHPVSWYHEYDGGRAWATLGGHTKESYSEELFLNHILGGIKYAANVK
jgi:TonB family protein